MKRLPFVIRRGNLEHSEAELSAQVQDNINLIRRTTILLPKDTRRLDELNKELSEGRFSKHFKLKLKGDEFDCKGRTAKGKTFIDILLSYGDRIEEHYKRPFEESRAALMQFFKIGGVA